MRYSFSRCSSRIIELTNSWDLDLFFLGDFFLYFVFLMSHLAIYGEVTLLYPMLKMHRPVQRLVFTNTRFMSVVCVYVVVCCGCLVLLQLTSIVSRYGNQFYKLISH